VIVRAGSADGHIQATSNCLYGSGLDPEGAYSEVIKAVEAAARIILEPDDQTAKLGTMRSTRVHIGAMGGRSSCYVYNTPTRPEVMEKAVMALVLR
jgi:hypothetical protein